MNLPEYQDDPVAREAKRLGYRSRSALKLVQLDQRFSLLGRGRRVLDLGAAPGGWAQVAVASVGHGHKITDNLVVAIDQRGIAPIAGVTLIIQDVFQPLHDSLVPISKGKIGRGHHHDSDHDDEKGPPPLACFDVVLSDLAPATTGQIFCDQERSATMARHAFEIAKTWLVGGGDFVCKIFQGEGQESLVTAMQGSFATVRRAKPKASRPRSKEMFLVGQGFKHNNHASNNRALKTSS